MKAIQSKTREELEKEMEKRREQNMESDFVPTPQSIAESNEEKVKAFTAARQQKEKDVQETKALAAKMLYDEVMNKSSLYNSDQLAVELIEIIKGITAKNIIDGLLAKAECPLIPNPNWPECDHQPKGSFERCHCADFMHCPSFIKYMTHRITPQPKRKKEAKKEN